MKKKGSFLFSSLRPVLLLPLLPLPPFDGQPNTSITRMLVFPVARTTAQPLDTLPRQSVLLNMNLDLC